jgi:hypothetical protein
MAELENIAHQMGHNLSTQQTYAKYDKNEWKSRWLPTRSNDF